MKSIQALKSNRAGSTVVIHGTNATSSNPTNMTSRYQSSGLLARSTFAPQIAQATYSAMPIGGRIDADAERLRHDDPVLQRIDAELHARPAAAAAPGS